MGRRWIVLGLAAGAWLAACADQGKLREEDLANLMAWLPGSYDNTAQADADIQQGRHPPHDKVALVIIPIDAPMLRLVGHNMFYLQEMAADDERRVMSQKVLAFDVGDSGIVEREWSLTEPRRWRDGHLNPDLFRSLVVEDLGATPGCELMWKRDGERFVGTNDPRRCRGGAYGAGLAQLHHRAELGADELAIAEVAYDRSGHVVQGRTDDPFNRFRRRGE
jgi:CpeT/CpcT family (DUF1001)